MLRADEADPVRVEPAGQPGQRAADDEGLHLRRVGIDAAGRSGELVVAHRAPGAAVARGQQARARQQRQRQRRDADRGLRQGGVRAPAGEREGAHRQAGGAVGERLPARERLLDDEGEGERAHAEIQPAQPARRQAGERAADRTGSNRSGQGQRRRHAARDQQRLRIGAERDERGLSERDLPRLPHHHDHAEAGDGVGRHQGRLAERVVGAQPGEREQQHREPGQRGAHGRPGATRQGRAHALPRPPPSPCGNSSSAAISST